MLLKTVADHKVKIFDEDAKPEEFKIKIDGKAFAILADGIYSNKIKAIIRELSANSRDSHVAAGHNNPFKVHLPTSSRPVFYVEDFGVGLSPKQVRSVYTQFFASDKENSNDYIGALGLGSKTPFCYNTRSFTVESWFEQTRYVYNCFLNEKGIPSYVKQLEEPSDRVNGVKVSFAVARTDFYTFQNEAEEVYKWFDIRPTFIGEQIDIEEPVRIHNEKDWALTDKESYVLMGNICYPIDTSIGVLDSDFKEFDLELRLNIGDVEIESSREGLTYTKTTVKKLNEKLKEIKSYLGTKISQEIAGAKSMYGANLKLRYYQGIFSSIVNKLPISWNGCPLDKNVFLTGKYPNINFTRYTQDQYGNRRIRVNTLNTFFADHLVIDDMGKGSVIRTKQHLDSVQGTAILLEFNSFDSKDKTHFNLDVDDFLTKIGAVREDVKFASELPYVKPVVNRVNGNYTPLKEVMIYNQKCRRAKDTWMACPTTPTNGLYVIRSSYQLLNKEGVAKDYNHLAGKLIQLSKIDPTITIQTIYGIRKADSSKIVNDPQWENVWDYVERITVQLKNDHFDKVCQTKVNNEALSLDYDQQKIYSVIQRIPQYKVLCDTYKDYVKKTAKDWADQQHIYWFFSQSNSVSACKAEFDMKSQLKEIVKKYPFLMQVGSLNMTPDVVDGVLKYIKAVDLGL